MSIQSRIAASRTRRKFRVRNKIEGTPERPRLSVFRSGKHIYAQLIDDLAGKTLASASTLPAKADRAALGLKHGANVAAAKVIGTKIAEAAKAAGITKVAFDRGPYRYHGRVKALADAAREGGLQF
ncbi:MAG: 50S ribosomal protein L18 [Gemmataceae bacterium]|nr:50S ribosomal protein L18 [Gemmataceae bacterium]